MCQYVDLLMTEHSASELQTTMKMYQKRISEIKLPDQISKNKSLSKQAGQAFI